ncbi:lytic murein transglycosylase [Nocardia takedensis]
MRMSAPITASALLAAGVVMSGSAAESATPAPEGTSETLLAAAEAAAGPDGSVGLLPVVPGTARSLHAVTPTADGPLPAGAAPALREIALPDSAGALGIPEISLAAYRNAELALESAMPNCGLHWNLLAGIGRIESGHAFGGRTDAAGTTVTPILGPSLDGTLPGNEVIPAAGGGYVRAVGPMQFLPGTWSRYSADGNGDGIADPHNVFDAALGAGKYLCADGLDLRDPAQELRAVLRYNNSMAYAADVLSWSAAYRDGGTPSRVPLSPQLIPPGTATPRASVAPQLLAAGPTAPGGAIPLQPMVEASAPQRETPPLVTMPGLTLECGVLCQPVLSEPEPEPAPQRPQQQPFRLEAPEPAPQPAPVEPPPPTHQPSITLPMGIVIPLPMPQT